MPKVRATLGKRQKGATRFYAADDEPQKLHRNHKPKAAKLRASITPGTVLIVLAGRFRGKRVVFLKQLESGLLLVTGPYKVNGVPLRRLNQAYVIATSKQVNIGGVSFDDVTDAFFARAKTAAAEGEEAFLTAETATKKVELPADRLAKQSAVDTALVKNLSSTERAYLRSKFTLRNNQRPHDMSF